MLIADFWTWDGWNALVAIGTLTLAGGTGVLAWMTQRAVRESRKQIDLSTRELTAVQSQTDALVQQTEAVRNQAEATERQVAISSASLEAASRPVLVGIAPSAASSGQREQVFYEGRVLHEVEIERIHYLASPSRIHCSVPLRNVGAGVAFVQRVSILDDHEPIGEGRVSQAVVPPQQLTRARFSLSLQENGQLTNAARITAESGRGFVRFTVYIVYTGASSELVTGSEVTIAQLPGGAFLVTGNEIYDGGGATTRNLLASTQNVG